MCWRRPGGGCSDRALAGLTSATAAAAENVHLYTILTNPHYCLTSGPHRLPKPDQVIHQVIKATSE
jgi:hypothetical protein